MTSSAKRQRITQLSADAARIERGISALKKGDIGLELDEAACSYQREHPDASYSDALDHVLKSDEALAAQYVASFGQRKLSRTQVKTFGVMPDEGDADSPETAGAELDRLVRQLMRENTGLSYTDAMQRVIEERPDLGR